MKILVVTQYFWPESFRINDLVLGLHAKGHDVTVLTAKPNYPNGKFFGGYSFFGKSEEIYEGIKVIRVPIIPRFSGRGYQLALNYLSFIFFSSIFGVFFCRGKKFDAVFSFLPSPLTSALPALLLSKIKRAPVYLWVQDLWPESVEAIGAIKSKYILGIIERVVKFIYQHADNILVSSKSFEPSVRKYLLKNSKIQANVMYFPNPVEDLYRPVQKSMGFKEKYGLPSGFILMFAGNVGYAQDFPNILNTAEKLKDHKDIKFVILGEGRHFSWVKSEVEKRNLSETVILLGRHPSELMPQFFSHAEVMLVTLKDEPVFKLTVPCKIQSYLACAKPIISVIDGEGGEIVVEAGAGLAVSPGDPDKFAKAILKMYQAEVGVRKEMSEKALTFHMNNFRRELLIDRLEGWMLRPASPTLNQ